MLKMRSYNYILIGLLFAILLGLGERVNAQSPKREFRGVWIATVKNIDWPKSRNGNVVQQQREFRELLELHRGLGMNAAIVQVRPAADAYYDSRFEPWSEWLNGKQGQAPKPWYDPLAFMVEETHRKGMEFHAWLNPYRAIVDYDSTKYIASDHVFHQHPEWFVQYGKNLYFDPGIPEARDFVIEVIADVVRRYDIDAIHFDDYFYPYKIEGQAFPDTSSYARYRGGFNDVDAWRRNNINAFVQLCGERIKAEKSWVKFGISPFGVWRNQDKDPTGSATRAGQTCYDDLYADVLTWMSEGWIDYLLPQQYWSIGYEPAAFDVLADWWDEHDYDRHLYIGQGAYKINNNHDKRWESPSEVPNQIRMIRRSNNLRGSAWFSAKSFQSNPLGINDSLRRDLYQDPALIPTMSWLPGEAPIAPMSLEASPQTKGMVLTWQQEDKSAVGFAIYRFEGKSVGSLDDSRNLIAVIRDSQPYFIDNTISRAGKYTYIITALDRLHHESRASLPVIAKMKGKYLK